jgi:hypothetical protein
MRVLLLAGCLVCTVLAAAPVEVRVVREKGRVELWRGGQPYLIKGAGGDERALESIAGAGGNSVRLWGQEGLGQTLEAAHKHGLTVCAGIWLGQVRQGFNWSDAASLARQRDRVRAVVEKHKEHPALLLWALGNEMEDPQGKNAAVWTQINALARMVKEIDPRHPTMTVVAEINEEKVRSFHALCQDVDMLGINSYAGAPSVAERYERAGGTKPFILTEYGPPGIWEIGKDALGAYPEPTSTEKAEAYRRAYRSAVLGKSGLCLGSYAFLWGQKQEVTSTWFSMLLKDGTRLAAAEAVGQLWSGRPPANRVPVIHSLTFEGAAQGKPGASLVAVLRVSDPEGDLLNVQWVLQRDPGRYGTGGDKEETPAEYPGAITKSDERSATIILPEKAGLYRLFAFVRDSHGGGAVANVSLRVNAPLADVEAYPMKSSRVASTELGSP